MIQPQAPPVDPLPPNRAESLELAKSYREFARYYFTVRSNASYLNNVAAGTFTYFFAQRLVDDARREHRFSSHERLLDVCGGLHRIHCFRFMGHVDLQSTLKWFIFIHALDERPGKGTGRHVPTETMGGNIRISQRGGAIQGGSKGCHRKRLEFPQRIPCALRPIFTLPDFPSLSQWVMLILGTVAFGYGYYRLVKFVADVEAGQSQNMVSEAISSGCGWRWRPFYQSTLGFCLDWIWYLSKRLAAIPGTADNDGITSAVHCVRPRIVA